ncbi:MAG: hypothetical protein MUC76_13510 [Spirochaetes bacterium]|nr:hypothetical protein [Spirochaetota bacterium]
MRSIITIIVAVCLALLTTVSCREELFELVGDHDISLIYSDDPSFMQPPATFVRELRDGRIEIEVPGLLYARVINVSGEMVELLSIAWIQGPLIELSFSSLPGFPAIQIPPYDFSIDFTGTTEESDTFRIDYRTGGGGTRELFVVVNGNL